MTHDRIHSLKFGRYGLRLLVIVAALTIGAAGFAGCGSSSDDDLDAANARVVELEDQLAELDAANARVVELEDQLAELDAANARVVGLEDQLAELDAANARVVGLEDQLAELEGLLDDAPATDVVVVGGGPLTARQQAMVDLYTGAMTDAWRAADAEAVAALYTPDGRQYDIAGERVLSVEDGSLQDFADNWAGLTLAPQVLVHDDHIMGVVSLAGVDVGVIVEFTETDDLLIESVAMYDSALAGSTG